MNWQTPAALAIVAGTAAVFVWRRFGPRRDRFRKATGCGCSTAGAAGGLPGLVVHCRRGESQKVEVRMPGSPGAGTRPPGH